MTEVSHNTGYLLGDSPAELRHLAAQAEVYAPEARELLARIGLRQGAHAIDIGCGVLGILRELADRVGPGGRVVGLDREPAMVRLARALAADQGLAAEVVQADAAGTGLETGSFDLVHARTVLLTVTDPEAIVREMARLARPGGIVALQEPDSASWVCDPPHPAWDPLRDAVTGNHRDAGLEFGIGRRAGRLLRDAGLGDVQTRPTARGTRPGEYYHTFLLSLAHLVREQILSRSRLTGGELDELCATVRAHLETPGTVTCQPLMWQAWGTKPQ